MLSLKKRVLFILIIYISILLLGFISVHYIDKYLLIEKYDSNSLTAEPFIDDFVRVGFTCSNLANQNIPVDFVVFDEYNNVWHNSSHILNCSRLYNIDLQANPWDFSPERKYVVYAYFNNHSINSGYFSFREISGFENIKLRITSYFSFMIFQNHMAFGTYCDKQRLLWLSTKEDVYGKNFMKCQSSGLLFILLTVAIINTMIWVFSIFFLRKEYKNKRRIHTKHKPY